MDAKQDRTDRQQPAGSEERADQGGGLSAEEALESAPPGSSVLNASPATRSPSDNPVRQTSRDAGDILADQVRDGEWNTSAEKRDEARGS